MNPHAPMNPGSHLRGATQARNNRADWGEAFLRLLGKAAPQYALFVAPWAFRRKVGGESASLRGGSDSRSDAR